MSDYQLSTAEEIYRAVLAGIKKESTAVLPPDGFNELINNSALMLWLKEKAGSHDYDQEYVDTLRNLYRTSIVSAISDSKNFRMPKDYFRLQSVSFSFDADNPSWVPAKRIALDKMSMLAVNPYRTPSDKRLYYYQEGSLLKNYPENDKVKKARIFYLTYPKPIVFSADGNNQNGNLTREQNKELVDIAVRIFIERVKEERYQTVIMEESLKMQKSNR